VVFISVIKQLEYKCRDEEDFKEMNFPTLLKRASMIQRQGSEIWKESMDSITEAATTEAWGEILRNFGFSEVLENANGDGIPDDFTDEFKAKLEKLCLDFDSDKNAKLDMTELGKGLKRYASRPGWRYAPPPPLLGHKLALCFSCQVSSYQWCNLLFACIFCLTLHGHIPPVPEFSRTLDTSQPSPKVWQQALVK
jgi:hypothetical protein